MELIVSRLNHHYLGLKVVLKEQDDLKTIAIINGNNPEFAGPIILLSLDQHTIYGLSHPEVISRILEKGPQNLLTSKEISHNLFEHGMKASLSKIKINTNYFYTSLDTFYVLSTKVSCLSLLIGKENQLACLIQPRLDLQPILLSNSIFSCKETDTDALKNEIYSLNKIETDSIRTYVTTTFKPNTVYGSPTTK